MSEIDEFFDDMDELQREVEESDSDSFEILYKKLGRLPTCKELADFEENNHEF